MREIFQILKKAKTKQKLMLIILSAWQKQPYFTSLNEIVKDKNGILLEFSIS
jgi:hypothetical protein